MRQFWADTVEGDVMWDLAYLHGALRGTDCIELRRRGKWSRHFQSLVGQCPGSEVHLCDPTCEALSQHRVANTTAIIYYLWLEASASYKRHCWTRFAARNNVYAWYLKKAASLAIEAIQSPSDCCLIAEPYGNLRIQTDGAVIGLLPMLRCHKLCFKVFEEHWKVWRRRGRLETVSMPIGTASSTLSLFE